MQTSTATVRAAQLGEAMSSTHKPEEPIVVGSKEESLQPGPANERVAEPNTLPEIPKAQKWILWVGYK